ncbi:MAG TPA: NUDIX domain-containing protein [Candidatus Dormibacteraeota bacterium]|nr:NUDIX domain-containing protein [Candidatus Dormibacteraeota bacterium]
MPTPRRAARLVLLDPDNRVLLLKVINPTRGVAYWVTPGGGLNGGESHADAARRELEEETGLQGADVGPALWRNRRFFRLHGEVFAQEEIFHLARTAPFDVDMSGLEEWEKETHRGHRWWSLEEIEATEERVYPRGLGALLRGLLDDGPPAEILDIEG